MLDKGGDALAYGYFEDELGRRSAAKLLTRRGPAHRSQYREAAAVVGQGEKGPPTEPAYSSSSLILAEHLAGDRIDEMKSPAG